MNLDEEVPEIMMDMTRLLGFRDDYDRFYSLFVKEVRDGKLGHDTLDTLDALRCLTSVSSLHCWILAEVGQIEGIVIWAILLLS